MISSSRASILSIQRLLRINHAEVDEPVKAHVLQLGSQVGQVNSNLLLWPALDGAKHILAEALKILRVDEVKELAELLPLLILRPLRNRDLLCKRCFWLAFFRRS